MPFELAYQVFGRDDRIVTRRKRFRTEQALRAFIRRLKPVPISIASWLTRPPARRLSGGEKNK